MSLISTQTLRTTALQDAPVKSSERSNVFPLQESQSHLNGEEELTRHLTTSGKDPITKIRKFFTGMYSANESIKPDSQSFVKWQIVLSQCVLEGQRSEDICRGQSPMEIAEFLQVGYFGAMYRSQKAGKPAFFDLWLDMALNSIGKR